ncbi:MAG: hypothetical protein KGL91_06755 [Xanthomonadaceae bacterium]|nr:hypothetical protein [Xanthomonadaceae bacterium]
MNANQNDRTTGKARHNRTIQLAPMTRAVRSALATSALTLAVGLGGNVAAANHTPVAAHALQFQRAAIDIAPVVDLTVVHDGLAFLGGHAPLVALAINQYSTGDVVIDNTAAITEIQAGNAIAISGYSNGGLVDITNHGGADLVATSSVGSAIGIYGYATTGDVGIDNAADIQAYSAGGLADGIFASGTNVSVTNTGAIGADGYSWAAGIEAQAVDVVTVNNSGDITASVYANGQAFGIYATGNDVTVVNSGNLQVQGYYATGIEAQSYGGIHIDNSGAISTYSANGLATGINVTSGGEAAAVTVTNAGDLSAVGMYGGTGISAVSGGIGGSVDVANTGNIYAQQGNKYGLGAYGIVTMADGSSTVTNSGGITVVSEGAGTGISSVSFAGEASIDNTGDVNVTSNAALTYTATGLSAFSANGSASIANGGNVTATAKYIATAVDAKAFGDVGVVNTGTVYASGDKYAYGIRAFSSAGDVNVGNAAGADIGFYSYAGRGFGVLGVAYTGNVNVSNAGTIEGYAYAQAAGIFGFAGQGNVGISNSGDITVKSASGAAVGAFARAVYGVAAIDNSGAVDAYSQQGAAYGLFARADAGIASVSSSGTIKADGYLAAAGILAMGYYGAFVSNTGGSIDVFATGKAIGIQAGAVGGDAVVSNAADIQAIGLVSGADGIVATSGTGYAAVLNSGAVQALSMLGDTHGITAYSVDGNVVIENHGDVLAYSYAGQAIGLYGYSVYGNTTIANTGTIYAASYLGLADAIFASGNDVVVANTGALTAVGDNWAAGIEAQGANATLVSNGGDITATAAMFGQIVYAGSTVASADGGTAFGIYATAGAGGAQVVNSGNLTVNGGYATGIFVQSYGDILISNSGNIDVGVGLHQYDLGGGYTLYYGTQVATGISATSNGEAAAVQVSNTGDITANGTFGAYGISAVSSGLGGTVTAVNGGNIVANQANKYGVGVYGVFASADGDSSIGNSGTITATSAGAATGVAALSFAGDALVVNSGDIHANSTAMLYYGATGVVAFAGNGTAVVSNSGTITAQADAIAAATAHGVDAQGQQGATVYNSGSIYANSKYRAYGVFASSAAGDVAVKNAAAGDIGFYSFAGRGFGVLGVSYLGDVGVVNAGTISGYAYGQASGVFAFAAEGDAGVSNAGHITVQSGNNTAVGVFARADYGTATVVNSGDITATSGGAFYPGTNAFGVLARGDYAQVGNSGSINAIGYYTATGIAARSYYGTIVSTSASSKIKANALLAAVGIDARADLGNVAVSNGGSILATSAGTSIGIAANARGNIVVNNTASGNINATQGALAAGIQVNSSTGSSTVNNAGVIHAGGAALSVGVKFDGVAGSNVLNNLAGGKISADGADGAAFAVYGGAGNETINNSGRILGAVWLGAGVDTFNNLAGGVWDLQGTTHSDFGAGDDVLTNAVGGTITIGTGKVEMGAGDDRLINAGTITIGNGGVISFGDGNDSANNGGLISLTGGSIQMGAGSNVFTNGGTIVSIGSGNSINVGAAGTFTSGGLLNFVNGATTDKLAITGTFAGTGNLNLDFNLVNATVDQLTVTGSMASSAVQKVNVAFPGMPQTAHTSAVFATVSGTSVAGNFVAGQMIGYNYAANFLDVGLTVSSVIDTSNVTADKFSINVDVNGLNDTGTLAASAASGAAGVMNTQMGTFRQRLGVNPYGDPGKVLSAFVRGYTDQGDMKPGHFAANFGQGGHFNYRQASWGREIGVNANLFENLHAGLVLGNADSRQRLTDGGVGENRLSGATVGGYLTWYVPNSFYVDFNARKMGADIRSTSAAGVLTSYSNTTAYSLEAGYEWNLGTFNLVPQLQYTHTKVDNLKNFFGDRVNFEAHGGTFTRTRLGLELNKTFQVGDVRWTPYGSLNAVRDSNGKSTYTVGNFFGNTEIRGTSAMAELGLGMQKGGFGFNIGANWADGGAYKSFVGGQASVRFSW